MSTFGSLNFNDKKVIIRVDFNVPLNEKFEVTDNTRIKAAMPTIEKILNDGGAVILMSHLGRPKNGPAEEFSLKHIIPSLSQLSGKNIRFAKDCIGSETSEMAAQLKAGEILLLENLRFYREEEAGDKAFAKKLSELADFYVNDAFGTAHRAHASTAVIAEFFNNNKSFGYLIENEIKGVEKIMKTGESPITAIIGGAKVSSKLNIITNLFDTINNLIIGGGMAFTFIKAKGGSIGNSLVENDYLENALEILKKAAEKNVNVLLPIDCLAADKFSNDAKVQLIDSNKIPDGWMGLDAGPESISAMHKVISSSKTILWNGPIGVFEFSNFSKGTKTVGESIVAATKNGAFSLVGGGDSVAAANQFELADDLSYISTGGGALLEFLEGKDLPGIAAIRA